jgi:FkbM family methyltransferase
MIQVYDWWMPTGEEHLPQYLRVANDRREGRLRYQGAKYDVAMRYVKQRRVAADCGAHIGLFSHWLAKDFTEVIAFEPVAEHQECWRANMAGVENARLECCALGETPGTAHMANRKPGSSGDTGVDPVAERSSLRFAVQAKGEAVPMRTLDDYELPVLDFLKIDTEGYEVFIVRGARKTLQRCHPCVMVEQKPEVGHAERYGIGVVDAVTALKGYGASVRAVVKGDYILTWGK